MTSPPADRTGDAGTPQPPVAAPAWRAVPGSPAEWVVAAGRVSGLLLALAAAERDGVVLPEPLADRRALRAWARLRAPVVAAVRSARPCDGPVCAVVDLADVDLLGGASRALGRQWCSSLVSRAGSPIADILQDEACVHEIPAEDLIAELARVHGVLDVDVDDGAGSAAHVVRALWCAGG
ncbi:MAG: hypothetical protein L0I76_33480 [Pseudonocardia sp.]|nr:hypothetical protein [Pseudonocardia sp.]